MKSIIAWITSLIAMFVAIFTSLNVDIPTTEQTTSIISQESILLEDYAKDFPVITKAVLYTDNVPKVINSKDERIIKMVNYIMCSVNEGSYGYNTGVISNSTIESFYKPEKGMYLLLDLDPQYSIEFNKYDKAVISGKTVILIDSDSTSYLGEGNPVNRTIIPYYDDYEGLDNTPEFLPLFFEDRGDGTVSSDDKS